MSFLDLIRKRVRVMDVTEAYTGKITFPGIEDVPIAIDHSLIYRHWGVHYPDRVIESVLCPPVSFAELMRLDSNTIDAVPIDDLNTNTGAMSCNPTDVLIDPDMHSCDECKNLSSMGVCAAATKLGAMPGYRPRLGRRFDHRCPKWQPP